MTADYMDDELEAMAEIRRRLSRLDDAAAVRVVRWLGDRYGVSVRGRGNSERVISEVTRNGEDASGDVASIYEAANPSTTAERVMVVTYWFQVVQGDGDVDSQKVNTELKQLGHQVKNITRAFSELIGVRPQLVIQVRKGGSTRQARKRYRLTTEGIKRIKALLAGGTTDDEP
ncbi:MAG TPA: hypothetical protein VK256_02510 [Candidatus Eisenbacteria bacterium]|nr:hypothetical protein [Candidatus Eisenbacteria bacterium]